MTASGAAPPELWTAVRKGASWSALNVLVGRTSQFLVGVLVARLISPSEFGVFAVALVVQAIVINVSELGVGAALVRRPHDTERIAPTVHTIAISMSTLLAAVMVGASGPLATLLGEPSAAGPVSIMALTVWFAGPSAVPSAILWRDFRQDLRFWADLANTVVSNSVLLVLVMNGSGAAGLAWGRVAGSGVSMALLLVLIRERYRPGLDRSVLRELLGFGLPLAGANFVVYATLNVDYVVVGKLLGATAVGLYLLAFNVASWPTSLFSTVIRSVTLPIFSRMSPAVTDQENSLADSFLAATRTVAYLTAPTCLMLSALSAPLIEAVYGSRWRQAAAALVFLGVFAVARGFVELLADLAVALGRTSAVLRVQILWLVALTGGLLVCVDLLGLAGAGIAHAVVTFFVVVPASFYVVRDIGVTWMGMMRAVMPPCLVGSIAALGSYITATAIGSPWWSLVGGGAVGSAVYIVGAHRVLRALLRTVRGRRAA